LAQKSLARGAQMSGTSFTANIAVSLWELRHRADFEQLRAALIDGYT